MTIQVECPCGRLLRVGEQALGKKARCPACGSVLIIPERPTAAPEAASLKGEFDGFDGAVTMSSKPIKIQTPAWLLYFGLLTAAAILWGTLATWKLRDRTAQMENALSRVDAAEKAAKAAVAQADEQVEAIRRQAAWDVEAATRKAETAESFGRHAEATRIAEEQKLLKQYSFLRKVVPGETVVHEEYLESFTIQDGVVHVKLRNTSGSSITADFSLVFFDKTGARTADLAWRLTGVDPGEVGCAGKPIDPKAGPPVYYNCHINIHAPPRVAAGNGQVGVEQDKNAAELSRIEEAFKNTGISQAKREEILRALCLAELRAQREADQRFPLQDNPQENLRYHDTMTPKYERAVYKKYGITMDQADLISLEANYRKWPLPRD